LAEVETNFDEWSASLSAPSDEEAAYRDAFEQWLQDQREQADLSQECAAERGRAGMTCLQNLASSHPEWASNAAVLNRLIQSMSA
jgi:hypothetical protein